MPCSGLRANISADDQGIHHTEIREQELFKPKEMQLDQLNIILAEMSRETD